MQNLESCPRYYTQNGQYCENPEYDYVFYECDSCLEKKVLSEALHKTTWLQMTIVKKVFILLLFVLTSLKQILVGIMNL